MQQSSVMVLPPLSNSTRVSDGSLTDGEDIFMTIDNDNGNEFFAIEAPKALLRNESVHSEKQISVDPISLQGSNIRQASFRLVSTLPNGSGPNSSLPLPPSKLKFVTASLSGLANSSHSSSNLFKKIWKSHNDQGSQNARRNLARMQSAVDDTHIGMRESDTRRSRSMGEARTSTMSAADDLDLWMDKTMESRQERNPRANSLSPVSRNYTKPPLGPSGENYQMRRTTTRDPNFPEDGFKCGKLCLFLPRGKGKSVRSSSSASTQYVSQVSQMSSQVEAPMISRTVSLERFECGSWSSLTLTENEEGEAASLFFDLPMELLRCSVSDMQSPVTAAFVFDNDEDEDDEMTKMEMEQNGPLASMMTSNKSQESIRHDRFSTSSPMSSPEYQVENEFDAFLEAQIS